MWHVKTFVVVSGKSKAAYGYALRDAKNTADQKRRDLSEQKPNV